MGDTFIFIMGLICTGTVVAATFLSINELLYSFQYSAEG